MCGVCVRAFVCVCDAGPELSRSSKLKLLLPGRAGDTPGVALVEVAVEVKVGEEQENEGRMAYR
jgi:hypothetical protein